MNGNDPGRRPGRNGQLIDPARPRQACDLAARGKAVGLACRTIVGAAWGSLDPAWEWRIRRILRTNLGRCTACSQVFTIPSPPWCCIQLNLGIPPTNACELIGRDVRSGPAGESLPSASNILHQLVPEAWECTLSVLEPIRKPGCACSATRRYTSDAQGARGFSDKLLELSVRNIAVSDILGNAFAEVARSVLEAARRDEALRLHFNFWRVRFSTNSGRCGRFASLVHSGAAARADRAPTRLGDVRIRDSGLVRSGRPSASFPVDSLSAPPRPGSRNPAPAATASSTFAAPKVPSPPAPAVQRPAAPTIPFTPPEPEPPRDPNEPLPELTLGQGRKTVETLRSTGRGHAVVCRRIRGPGTDRHPLSVEGRWHALGGRAPTPDRRTARFRRTRRPTRQGHHRGGQGDPQTASCG